MSEDINDYPPQPNRPGYVVIRTEQPDRYKILRTCRLCGKPSSVEVPAQGLWDWEHGAFIQKAFPELSAGEREQVTTGTHEACFDRAFRDED